MIEKSRNYGIDLLRILCMYMVVILHILGQGGILEASPKGSVNWAIAWLMRIGVYCAVNCYGLISGYVGIDAKYKYSNWIVLWLRVLFYTIVITISFAFMVPDSVGKGEMMNAIFPVMKNYYWYFTAYSCVFFFMPTFNFVIETMPKRQLKMLMIILLVIFSILPTVFQTDVFRLNGGYSALWLGILYLFGAYIKRNGILSRHPFKIYGLLYLLCVLLTWAFRVAVGGGLDIYTSPTMIAAAVSLLGIFAGMKISPVSRKIIGVLAPLSFSVYLLHVHPLVWNYIVKDRFTQYAEFRPLKLVLGVLVTAGGIYMICLLADIGRCLVFQLLKVRETVDKIEQRVREKVDISEKE